MRDLLLLLAGIAAGFLAAYWLTWDWFPRAAALHSALSVERAALHVEQRRAWEARTGWGTCVEGQAALARQVGHLTERAEGWQERARGRGR